MQNQLTSQTASDNQTIKVDEIEAGEIKIESHVTPLGRCLGVFAVIVLIALGAVFVALHPNFNKDEWTTEPFGVTSAYSFALTILCIECWFTEDPYLFNRTGLLFRNYNVPMEPFTRIFSGWHAGGVVYSFLVNFIAIGFRKREKSRIALCTGVLFFIWASLNTKNVLKSKQFYWWGILLHSYVGGCGLVCYINLIYYFDNQDA